MKDKARSTAVRILIGFLFLGQCVALGCRQEERISMEVTRSHHAIVNGEKETDFPGIGALTLQMGDNYTGSFCTGTLISPTWVITAAHCIDGGYNRMNGQEGAPDDTFFHFYVGHRADREDSGVLHQVSRIVVHPGWTARGGRQFYDIALMELANPVEDVDPYPIFTGDLTEYEGEELFYSGFGVSDGQAGTGGGTKRSKMLTLQRVYASSFSTRQNDGGVCFGDSGGPGLLMTEDGYRTAGVNSAAIGQVPCMGWSSQIRVDAFVDWIRSEMGEDPACGDNPEQCQCPEACGDDGVCDNAQCGSLRCGGVFECLGNCRDPECQYGCYVSLTPLEHFLIEQVFGCVEANCPERDNRCVQQNCQRELYTCYEGLDVGTGDATCGDIHWCAEACTTPQCVNRCFHGGTLDAQALYRPVENCIASECPAVGLGAASPACVARSCRAPLTECLPPEGCELVSGGCEDGQACVPASWGATYCRETEGRPVGAACELGQVQCASGALCLGSAMGAFCQALCIEDSDCPAGTGPCERRVAPGAPFPLGVCAAGCRDADVDGTCDPDDCAPDDGSIHPDADEQCENLADDDCDGQIDEGCVVCVDEDGDEVCADLDCDDENAERSPDLEEVCGDDIDNDCDENVDEGCVDAMPPPPVDAELEVDAAVEDAGAPDAVTVVVIPADGSSDAESGCSCSVDGGSRTDLILGAPLLLIAGLRRRRWARMSGGILVCLLFMSLGGCVGQNVDHQEPDPVVDAGLEVDAEGEDDASTGGLDASSVEDARIDTSVEVDAVLPDMESEDAQAPEPMDALVDAGAADMLAPDLGPPPPPSIARIQRGVIPAGTEVILGEVFVASTGRESGVFLSDGRADIYAGLWASIEMDAADLEMGASLNVIGIVREAGGEPVEGRELTTLETRTELEVTGFEEVSPADLERLPEPMLISLGEASIPAIAELYEGVLIELEDLEVSRVVPDGNIIFNGIIQVDPVFVPEARDWLVNGIEMEQVRGIMDFAEGRYQIVPRFADDLPRPPAQLGGCIPLGATYALCEEGRRWPAARDDCAAKGARLVILETEEENLAVGEMVRAWRDGSFWIGLSDRVDEGEFIWHDGSELTYSGWAGGEPNNYGRGEDCAESNWRGPGVWNDAGCGQNRVYVCEYSQGVPPCEGDEMCGDGRCVEGLCQREG